jgi:hypothetical protein
MRSCHAHPPIILARLLLCFRVFMCLSVFSLFVFSFPLITSHFIPFSFSFTRHHHRHAQWTQEKRAEIKSELEPQLDAYLASKGAGAGKSVAGMFVCPLVANQ